MIEIKWLVLFQEVTPAMINLANVLSLANLGVLLGLVWKLSARLTILDERSESNKQNLEELKKDFKAFVDRFFRTPGRRSSS